MNASPGRNAHRSRLVASLAAILLLNLSAIAVVYAGGVHFGYWKGEKGDKKGFQYALLERGNQTMGSISGDESWSTITKLQKEVKSTGRQILWFRVNDLSYVVRDPAVIRRAQEIVEPMSELGKQQGELGAQQGAIGARQGELGALQGKVGAIQGRIAALQATGDRATRAEAAELQRQLDELRTETHSLGQQQRALGERQRVLGERQRVLGERQAEASKVAEAQLRTLASSSIRSGKAEEL